MNMVVILLAFMAGIVTGIWCVEAIRARSN